MSTPTSIVLEKQIIHGYADLTTRKVNAGQTGYEGLPMRWTGQIDIEFTPSQEKTPLASGDDPRWGEILGPVLGTVKGTFYDVPLQYAEQMLSVKYSSTDGLVVGEDDTPDVCIGMVFDTSVKHETTGAVSTNKLILYKVSLDLPKTVFKTKGEGDNAVATIELNGKVWPAFYTKTNGTTGRRTYAKVNSVLNPTKFAAYAGTLEWPTDFTPDGSTPAVEQNSGSNGGGANSGGGTNNGGSTLT